MAGTKNNRRTRYTRQAIKDSFLQLLAEKDPSKITVTEICQQADINRGTFYQHFRDPADLFSQIEQDLLDKILPILAMRPKDHLEAWLNRFIEVLQENAVVGRLILKDYQDSRLLAITFNEVHDLAISEFRQRFQEDDPQLLEYYFAYFVKGTIGTILQWLEDGSPVPAQALPGMLIKVLQNTQ